MDIMIRLTMPKVFAIIAIINLEEIKNHGTVLTKSYMQVECAKIVISICIIKRREKKLILMTQNVIKSYKAMITMKLVNIMETI